MDDNLIGKQEHGLHQSLSKAQITMIGLGGAIGTGLFLGSGIAIGYAGPAVLISYLIAGFAAVVMVFSLSEMAVVHPTAGSFGIYAETYLNPWAGFVVRYTYWLAQVIAVGGEAVAAGVYMRFWYPDVPIWMWSLGFAFILLYLNSRSVGNFGTVEYWFAFIKVAAIIVFIILGTSTIFGIGQPATGTLSSMNTNIYLCSRMLFSLSRGRYAPAFLGRLSANGTPVAAILLSGASILVAAAVSVVTPLAYNYLFGVALFGAIIVWMIILASHIGFRRHHKDKDLPVRMPLFPYMQIAGLTLLGAILITMGLDTEFWNISWIVGVPWLVLITGAYFYWKRSNSRRPAVAA